MADERNLVDEEDAVKENSTKNRREKKKREKKEKKEKKNAKGNAPEPGEDEDEKGGGRLILVLTTILIIAIWMGIIGILINTDVGGFGSTVLYPLLKDVPYVNKILPQPEETVEQTEGTEHQYGSLSEAISQIKELEKELELSRKQYEFYRDKLLTFDGGGVEWKRLGDIAEICTGSRNTQDAVENGRYDFFVRSQTPLKLDEYDYDDESVVTAGDGVGVGKVFHITYGKYALHQRAYRIHPLDKCVLNVKYLYYIFSNNFYDYIMMQKYNGSVASVRLPMLKSLEIPIPFLTEQERIVKILDKFDTLTTSLTSGLPAEIKLRKQQ